MHGLFCREQERPLSYGFILYTAYVPSPVFSLFFPTSPDEGLPDTSLRPAPGFSHPNSGPKFGSTAFLKPVDSRPGAWALWGTPALAERSLRPRQGPAPPLPRTSRPVRPPPALRPQPSALLPLAVREVLRLSRCLCRRSRPLFRVSAAATTGGIRGSLIGLAPRLSRPFSLPPAAAAERGSRAAEPLGASVLALFSSPGVLEKRPRPGNGTSRFQR